MKINIGDVTTSNSPAPMKSKVRFVGIASRLTASNVPQQKLAGNGGPAVTLRTDFEHPFFWPKPIYRRV
jgi:hypothetical protein